MKARILISMFCGGFSAGFARHLREIVTERKLFAFVASDFEQSHERTDYYFEVFSKMFTECGIQFDHCCVVDGRMTKPEAQAAVKNAGMYSRKYIKGLASWRFLWNRILRRPQ